MEPFQFPLDSFICINCKSEQLYVDNNERVVCSYCKSGQEIGPHGCLNSLISPSLSVLSEIKGMMSENPELFSTINDFLYQKVERVSQLSDRISLADAEGLPKNYYRSTSMNFEYAFSLLKINGSEKVLEIGAEHDYPFLSPFLDSGCECFASNLYFIYEEERKPDVYPVLSDMNNLPFKSNLFDVVLMSATSHHSPDLNGLFCEVSRILKSGGRLLMLNDPTRGFFKHSLDWLGMGTKKGGNRDHQVNENEYSSFQYRSAAANAGFSLDHSFFSRYYDQKLTSGELTGVRFSPLAKFASMFWKWRFLRNMAGGWLLYPLQQTIGLELNMVFSKK